MRRVVTMESVASNIAHAVIKNFPVLAGRNVESSQEYNDQAARLPVSPATPNAVAEHKRL